MGCQHNVHKQKEPEGLAHAVLISEEFLGQEKFVMYLGDNMFEDSLHEVVKGLKHLRQTLDSFYQK